MEEVFKFTEKIAKKYPNIPQEELEALNWYPLETAEEIIKLLSEEDRSISKVQETWDDLDSILELEDIYEIVRLLELKYNVKIYLWEKKNNSESLNIWYISLFKGNMEIWEIWTDLYDLWNWDLVDSHLWIELYWDNQWKWYGKMLYKLYKRWSELDSSIYWPEEEFASKNSRIVLLTKMWYELDSVYEMWDFRKLSDKEKRKILEDANRNYYDRQEKSYKFIYIW